MKTENSTKDLMTTTISFPYNDVEDSDLELLYMEKKRKEILVKKKHKNKISEPTEQFKLYRTRAPWAKNGRLTSKTYDGLIDLLYVHYYGVKEPDVPTLKDAAYAWAESRYKCGAIEYNTAEHYMRDYDKYVGELPISNEKVNVISKLQLFSLFEGIVGDGTLISAKTLSNVKTVINGAFDYANMMDGVTCIDSRCIRITDLKRKCFRNDNSDEVYSEEDIRTLLAHLRTIKPTVYSLAVALNCCLPVRIGELRAIKWADYDEDSRILHLNHSIVCKKEGNTNRKAVDVDYMKSHSESGKRDIELSDYAVYVLGELKKINGAKKYILQSRGDMPISTNNYNEHLRSFCNECGITYRSSHKIRFYACSRMYELGLDETTIQKKMGHSSIAMTRHYNRSKGKDIDRETINALFGYELPEVVGNTTNLRLLPSIAQSKKK